MKIRILVIVFGLTFTTSLNAQSVCSKYYPMGEGTTFELTSYNGDKVTSIVSYLISDSQSIPGGQKATINTEIMDKKGEVTATSSYDIICENDLVSIDFKSLMGPDVYSQFPDMEMDVSGTALQLPNNLQEGQSLPDADLLAVVNMTPIKMRLTFMMTNRKVVGRETVTTPAGTFDCVVITYDYESKFGVKVRGSTKQWIAENVGIVLQRDMNKKGKEVANMKLTKFKS